MGLKLITPPAEWPITIEEAKAHLRLDGDDDNALVESLLDGAVDYCDGPTGFLGRALIDQTWELVLDSFPACDKEIKIPMPPLIEVVSVKYDDGAGEEQTLSSDQYTVDSVSEPGWLLPVGSWPSTYDGVNAVRVRFRCGFLGGSPLGETVPGAIKAAIKLILGNLYANRETIVLGQSVDEIPQTAQLLMRKYRIHLSMA